MESSHIALGILAIIIWGIVIIVYLVRGKAVKFDRQTLYEVVGRLFPDEHPAIPNPTPEEDDVLDNLLAFFDLCTAARRILKILTDSEEAISYKQLTDELNAYMRKKERHEIPEYAVRAIVINLIGANIVQIKEGDLSPTPAGKAILTHIKR